MYVDVRMMRERESEMSILKVGTMDKVDFGFDSRV